MLPTHVGMSLEARLRNKETARAPHTRGDEPAIENAWKAIQECSPHTWG